MRRVCLCTVSLCTASSAARDALKPRVQRDAVRHSGGTVAPSYNEMSVVDSFFLTHYSAAQAADRPTDRRASRFIVAVGILSAAPQRKNSCVTTSLIRVKFSIFWFVFLCLSDENAVNALNPSAWQGGFMLLLSKANKLITVSCVAACQHRKHGKM